MKSTTYIYKLTSILLMTFLYQNIIGCDCVVGKGKFGHAKSNEIFFTAKIIKHHEYSNPLEFIPNTNVEFYKPTSITELKVIDHIHGNLKDSILFFFNGESAACQISIDNGSVSDTILVMADYWNLYLPVPNEDGSLSNTYTENDIPGLGDGSNLIETNSCSGRILTLKQGHLKPLLKKRLNKKRNRKLRKLYRINGNAKEYQDKYIYNADIRDYIKYEKYREKLLKHLRS